MSTNGDPGPDPGRLNTEVYNAAWEQTIEDVEAIEDELADEGWETLSIITGQTLPMAPRHGDTDRFGIVYVVPGDKAEPFEATVADKTFPQYDVFRQEVNGRLFVVTELLDPETKTAVLLAGSFWTHDAEHLIDTVEEKDEMYTYVQKLDETQLGSFQHDEPAKFFSKLDDQTDEPQ